MIVEIINVGSELLMGEIINTNATLLQKMCKHLGFDVYHQSVVGDNEIRLLECFDIAFKRGANCIITTGGLGPTADDLTKELSAKYLGLEMIKLQEEEVKVIEKCQFLGQRKDVSPNNLKQAFFPKGCFILENEVGTANGCVMSKDEKMIINLPGPPKELSYVVEHSLMTYLNQYKQDVLFSDEIITMHLGESRTAMILEDVIDKQDIVSIAIYAGELAVRIRFACKAMSQHKADEMMKPLIDEVKELLGEHVLKEKNIKQSLLALNKDYCVEYLSDFRFHEFMIYGNLVDHSDLKIIINQSIDSLGDIMHITFKNKEKETSFNVPLLKDVSLNLQRLDGMIVSRLYAFLTI